MVGQVVAVWIHCRALGACVGACSGAAEITVLVLRWRWRNGIEQAGTKYEKRARGVNSAPLHGFHGRVLTVEYERDFTCQSERFLEAVADHDHRRSAVLMLPRVARKMGRV